MSIFEYSNNIKIFVDINTSISYIPLDFEFNATFYRYTLLKLSRDVIIPHDCLASLNFAYTGLRRHKY